MFPSPIHHIRDNNTIVNARNFSSASDWRTSNMRCAFLYHTNSSNAPGRKSALCSFLCVNQPEFVKNCWAADAIYTTWTSSRTAKILAQYTLLSYSWRNTVTFLHYVHGLWEGVSLCALQFHLVCNATALNTRKKHKWLNCSTAVQNVKGKVW